MPQLTFRVTVPAPLERVWQFHEDVATALPALSPPEAKVAIESADLPVRVGSRIAITARGPLGMRVRWVARITAHRPPRTGGAYGAEFADEQESGPFAAWRHDHVFDEIGTGATQITDRVTYRVPLGPLGVLADHLFVRRQVVRMFRHRHAALTRAFAAGLAAAPAAAVHSPA
jgi:ligand-binding SRPBCC domain-containing protein